MNEHIIMRIKPLVLVFGKKKIIGIIMSGMKHILFAFIDFISTARKICKNLAQFTLYTNETFLVKAEQLNGLS